MKKIITTFAVSTLLLGLATLATAQRQRQSPHEKVEATLDGKKVTIEYGRPYKKGREIFGKLVPYGKVWRTGADERTLLTTEADLTIGKLSLPAGSYSLWTVPGESSWELVVNKQAKGWGADWDYETKIKPEELGRAPMKVSKAAAPAEQFTIALDAKGKKATLSMSWDATTASVELQAK